MTFPVFLRNLLRRDAWFATLASGPHLKIWQKDGGHPAEEGRPALRPVFFMPSFFHESPQGLSYTRELLAEPSLFDELERLTKQGFERYMKDEYS